MKDLCEAPSGSLSGGGQRMFESDITASEPRVRTRVCDAGEAEGGRDPMRSVMRAYLRASTATAAAPASTADCRWERLVPFRGSAVLGTVRTTARCDAREPVIEGLQGAMPSVSAALRLVALAVIAQKDRDKSDGRCFRDAQSQSAGYSARVGVRGGAVAARGQRGSRFAPPPGSRAETPAAFDLWENGRLLPSCAEHNASPASQASGSPSAITPIAARRLRQRWPRSP